VRARRGLVGGSGVLARLRVAVAVAVRDGRVGARVVWARGRGAVGDLEIRKARGCEHRERGDERGDERERADATERHVHSRASRRPPFAEGEAGPALEALEAGARFDGGCGARGVAEDARADADASARAEAIDGAVADGDASAEAIDGAVAD